MRPRDLLGLLLEAGALAGLAVFAAGPVKGEAAAAERPLALVLDGSASTLAAGRFEEMRALAGRALAAAGPAAPAARGLAAGGVEAPAPPGSSREAVAAALAATRPRVCGGGSLAAAAEAALGGGGEVVVFTDGCDPEAQRLAARGDLRVVSVGRPEGNVALIGVSVERERGREPALWLRIRGSDGSVTEERRAALRRGLGGGWAVRVPRLGEENALAADDGLAALGDLSLPPLRVAALGKGAAVDPYLAAALEAAGPLVDRGRSVALGPEGWGNLAERPDVVVVRGEEGAPAGVPLLVLDGGAGEPSAAPAVQAGETRHPVLRGVDPAEWIVTRGRALEARIGDAVLLLGPGGPLALAGVRGGRRAVILGFDPAASTLPLSGSFPVMLRNALLWLSGGGEEGAPAVARAGERVTVPVAGGRERVTVRGPFACGKEPGGAPSFEVAVRDGAATFRVPFPADEEECLLDVQDGLGGRTVLATALLDAEESDLTPRVARNADGFAPPPRPAPGEGRRSPAASFALAAAVLLVLEWLLWAGERRGRSQVIKLFPEATPAG